jgi:DNA-binding transcriptional LysR family regulator
MYRLSSDDIALFALVVERGSFAAAAAETGQTASAVSRAISRLEDRLGVRLLERTTRRLSLTAEGESLMAHGEGILAAIERAETDVTAASGRPSGRVRVSLGTALARHPFAAALGEFSVRYPEIRLELLITDRRVDVIGEQVDVAIRTGPLADSSLIARRIGESRRVICASPDYLANHGIPQTPQELSRHRCMTIAGHAALAEWPMRDPSGAAWRVAVNGGIATDSALMLRDMAVAGAGIVRLAEFVISDALADGRLVPLLVDHHVDEPLPVWAITPPGRRCTPRVRAFIDFAAELCVGR